MKFRSLLIVGALMMFAGAARAQDVPGQGPAGEPEPRSSGQSDPSSAREVITDALSAVLTAPAWNFGISVFGGYNRTNSAYSNVTGPLASFVRSGSTAGVTTRLSTFTSVRRVTFGLSGGTSSTYFQSTGRVMTNADARASQSIPLGRRSTLSAGESISYAPYYTLNQYPGLQNFAGTQLAAPVQPGIDTAIGDVSQYRYSGMLQFTHPISDRTNFSANYTADLSNVGAANPSTLFQQAGARFSHVYSAGLGYHLGYSYGQFTFPGAADPTVFNNLDVGLDLRRALSLTRRTTFTFSTGTTMARRGTSAPSDAQSVPTRTEFNIIGHADLNHNIGRSWNARVSYNRAWNIIDGTYVPILGDAISAGVSGDLGRKATLGFNSSYLLGGGQLGLSSSKRQALVAGSFLSYVLNPRISGFVQYSFFRQHFDLSDTGLNLPSGFSRNSVRAGLTVSFRSR